jgi:hypothetical protein
MKDTPFITAKKQVRMLAPGDIIVHTNNGARFITEVSRDKTGAFVVCFGLNDTNGRAAIIPTGDDFIVFDREWGTCEVTVILGMTSTNQASEVELLRAQLAARDAALNAVLKLAKDINHRFGSGDLITELLVKHGVHAK